MLGLSIIVVEAKGGVAQVVEQGTENPRVGGSTPSPAMLVHGVSFVFIKFF